jgi:hypothetical protein
MADPTYECIPEGKGWIVMNARTSKPAELDGKPLTDLSFDDADEATKILNALAALLAASAEGNGAPPT